MPVYTGSTSASAKYPFIPYEIGTLEKDVLTTNDGNGATATVRVTVDFLNQGRFLGHMLGYNNGVYASNDPVNPGGIKRVLPERFAYNPNMYCVSCQTESNITVLNEPWSPLTNGYPEFRYVRFICRFTAPNYNIFEDREISSEASRFVVWSAQGNATSEKMPGGSLQTITTPPVPIQEVGVVTGREKTLIAKWLNVPSIDYDHIITLANKINQADITLNGVTYPAETLLFLTYDETPKTDPFGRIVKDYTFRFKARLDGRTWNKFWTKAGYVEVSSDGTTGGQRVFQTADFTTIFKAKNP